MEKRYFPMERMQSREDESGDLYLEGYFAVFNRIYEVFPGATESIAPGAFDESVEDDVRALYNHNTDLVLGRTAAGTMEIRQDGHGLWGKIRINKEDSDAMNAYKRIARGDITGCSFGFDIAEQDADYREDGTVHWTITKIKPLYEISPCTFPAYTDTVVVARKKDLEEMRKRRKEIWKTNLLKKLKGENHGTQNPRSEEHTSELQSPD